MVRGVNKVILLGNTAAEPDFRVLSNGSTSIATVGLATNESYRDQNGNITEQTEWHRLVFWGRTAEIARDYMRKGSQIYVEGKIKTRSYEDQQGIKRYTTEIHVSELHLLSQKSGNGASETAVEAAQAYQQQGYTQQAPAYAQQPAYGQAPQGGYPQAPAYAQQPANGGYQQQTPQAPAYGQAPQAFRSAPPAGAVQIGPATPAQAPVAAPAQAPVTPAAFQTAAPAAPQAQQDGNRHFKDDDLPF